MGFLFIFLAMIDPDLGLPNIQPQMVPENQLTVQICEQGLPDKAAWPLFHSPKATETYSTSAFGFFRVPHKYIDTGVRADRSQPYLLRAMTRMKLGTGTHRFLLRGRGAARLIIDGEVLISTPFPPNLGDGSDGRDPNTWPYLNLSADFRFAPPGNREATKSFTSQGQEHVIVLETIVGGHIGKTTYRRPELGETVVAISPMGQDSFQLLSPTEKVPYTDLGWQTFEREESKRLQELDQRHRQEARNTQANFWQHRRAEALAWLAQSEPIQVPQLASEFPVQNAIDHFLAEKRAKVLQSIPQKQAIQFSRDVRPILEAKCYSCHQGGKAKADLRLDRPSEAVIPQDADASELIARVLSTDENEVMPPQGPRLSQSEIATLRTWISAGASYLDPPGQFTELSSDLDFLRRVTLDTVGVVPTPEEIANFEADQSPQRRANVIDRLLADPRRADHWVSYWQDVLAENPNILNPTLNNTGPFRFWIHESYLDNKPVDLMVTELLRMRGSDRDGGPAGFAVASENDVPMAEKGIIVASAFLGANLKCARCHDAPAHKWLQQDLFRLGGMLAGKSLKVPASSSVPVDKLHHSGRKSLIQVTLTPGTVVAPAWPFPSFLQNKNPMKKGTATRDQLAEWLTDPRNERFAQVVVNRVWQRLMGRGIVEPVDDWERGQNSHPELLKYLGRELVRAGYDLQQLERLILNSHAYQRAADPERTESDAYFSAPVRRRMSAEQIVDSLFAAAGKPMKVGEINLDIDGSRDRKNSISLGVPQRAWEFASTSNERDRPSLALPRVQAVVDVLTTFGWRATRPDALTVRETSPDVLQPAVLSNGTVAVWVTRLTDDHAMTQLALESKSAEALVDAMYRRVLTRKPTASERQRMSDYLRQGFATRKIAVEVDTNPEPRKRPPFVSWSNHLTPNANRLKSELEAEARAGEPATKKLDPNWRERCEDALWVLLNSPEFIFLP